MRQLMALPFLPLQNIRLVYNNLRLVADQRLAGLFTYFTVQWMNGVDISMWCVDTDVRTTNNVEGWHSRFAKLVKRHHPNIWLLLSTIRQEQASTEVTIQQILGGYRVTKRKLAYKRCNKRIGRLRRLFARNVINSIQFLNGISHNLKA